MKFMQTEKKQLLIYVIIAYGITYVMPPFYFIHILYAYMTPILNNHTLFL